jgi:hypothetical protein
LTVFVLIVVGEDGSVEATLHSTRTDAERTAAEQIMNRMLTESALDLSGILTAMDQAFTKGEHPAVIRFFERVKRRKTVFIQEAELPSLQYAGPSQRGPHNWTS